ncbi:MAG TPA: hypothetical protein VG228_07565 [Solirubrobacteraceae bacterium]|nr:hypothetical protein [Solirubrobacteraceae bacterium]
MPQARTAGTSTSKPTAAKPATVKAAAAKPAAAKQAAAKAKPAAKPAAKRAAAKPLVAKSVAAKPAAKRAAARPAAAKTAAAKPTAAKSATAKTTGAGRTASGSTSRPRVNIDGAQVEALAERLRKLNEKIIEFGREAGENTLASYEKALKTIATGVQQSPAKDELEWISHLAASQAKFVREITDSWAKAARDRLK